MRDDDAFRIFTREEAIGAFVGAVVAGLVLRDIWLWAMEWFGA